MANHNLTKEARGENALALATLLGLEVSDAHALLDFTYVITNDEDDPVAKSLAREIDPIIARTAVPSIITANSISPTVEVIIGSATPRTKAKSIYVYVSDKKISIGTKRATPAKCTPLHPLLLLIGACYAVASTIYHSVDATFPFSMPDPLCIDFRSLGIDSTYLDQNLDIGEVHLAGAGAIGNAFLWAARHVRLSGKLHIIDDDFVSSGNLNRQIWFTPDDIGRSKAIRLAERAKFELPKLELLPKQSRLEELPEREGAWLRRLIVGVDSRRARRTLQNEFPGEVFDASTTDMREIVLHYNRQPTDLACLSCIYEPDQQESSRESHIAEHLGVSLVDVRSQRISEEAAERIVSRFPMLAAKDLFGLSYDTLFKQLCGEGKLKILGTTVTAPFAFVSILAGGYLVLDLIQRLSQQHIAKHNYWRISPWHPPLAARRTQRARQPDCKFCSDPILTLVNRQLWGIGS